MKSFKKPNYKYLIIPMAILAVIFTFLTVQSVITNCYKVSESAFTEGRLLSVVPKTDGFVIHVYVQDNQEVNKGDLLIEIDPGDNIMKLQKAEKDLRETKIKLGLLKRDLDDKYQDPAQTTNPFFKHNFNEYEKMYGEGIVSAPSQEKVQPDVNKPKTETEEEEVSPEELMEKIKQLESEIEQLKLSLSYTKVYAPQDGIIQIRDLREGDYAEIGQNLLSIVPRRVWITANFPEEQAAEISAGQPVIIRIKTYPTKRFKAVVDSVQYSEKNSGKVPVRIMFTEDYSDYDIKPGVSVTAIVKVK
ncbi:MAG: efflux RND transporter periplasmic adaptor subunit [Cyanobacteria bacterium RUI128]|nr:efflux RND transporter periplasmic adaptor subunit [Cyanobacteria bacterium RUI128]